MRLIHTEVFNNVIERQKLADQKVYSDSHAHVKLVKEAGDATTTYALSGELYASKSGWILLDVPNALVRGAFDALNEHGAELPPQSNKSLNAHISVMRPDELAGIGGVDKITERGHHFHYTLGPVQEAQPAGWAEMSKVWFIQVRSPELQDLRKSYGLTPRPNDNKFDFHITIAVRRKKILQNNDVAKAAELIEPKKEKQALPSILSAIHVGGLALDVAGLKALSEHGKPEEEDPALTVLQDRSALNQLRRFPTEVPPMRRRRPVRPPILTTATQGINPVIKEGEDNGLLELQHSEVPTEEKRPEHEDNASEVGLQLPSEGQEDEFDCGPAALEGIYKYYGIKEDLPAITNDTNANPGGGTAPDDIITNAKQHGLTVAAKNGMTIDELRTHVDAGHPVITPIQAYGDKDDYGKEDKAGHYVVVTGIDDSSVFVNDPAKPDKRGSIPLTEFVNRWHDEDKHGNKYNNFGIAVWTDKTPENTDAPTETHKVALEEPKPKKRKDLGDKLKSLLLPAGAAGVGAALHKPTDTLQPSQVTRFPGDPTPHVVRGPVYHGAPASVLEDTGGGYMYLGPESLTRSHGAIRDPETLNTALQSQQRPGHPLQKLEIQGHGTWTGQDLGDSHMNPQHQIGPRTVNRVAEILNNVPRTEDSSITGYGCNTGLCNLPVPYAPDKNWWQHLSDLTGMTAYGARGYTNTATGTGLWQDVHHTGRTQPGEPGHWPRVEPSRLNLGGDDYSFTRYQRGQAPERVQTQHRDNTSKETYMALPAGRLSELAYNIGKPSALAGAVAAPLLGDKQTAKRTALAATGLSLPMVLSELLARYGDAKGQIATGNAPDTMGTHLNAQSKALPYAALAALPLLSYGGANLLGRWKGQKPDEGSTAKSVGALSGGGAGMAAGSALGPLGAAGGGILGLLLGEHAGKHVHEKRKAKA